MSCLPDKDKDTEDSSDSNGDNMGEEYNGLSRPSMSSLAGKQSMQVNIHPTPDHNIWIHATTQLPALLGVGKILKLQSSLFCGQFSSQVAQIEEKKVPQEAFLRLKPSSV